MCLQGIQRKRPSEAQSAILRRHLLELTQSFIIPLVRKQPIRSMHFPSLLTTCHFLSRCKDSALCTCVLTLRLVCQERYMASLMPLQRSVTPWKVNRKWIISDDLTMMSAVAGDTWFSCCCRNEQFNQEECFSCINGSQSTYTLHV